MRVYGFMILVFVYAVAIVCRRTIKVVLKTKRYGVKSFAGSSESFAVGQAFLRNSPGVMP